MQLAAYLTHEARLNALQEPDSNGKRFPLRVSLERLALRDPKYAAMLEGPEMPEALRYLHTALYEVHGSSGATQTGQVLPVTWPVLESWNRQTESRFDPHELRALRQLDLILCYPPKEETED